ncbi:hypothetical protein CEXT_71641 [Caerostris extrusa]|uniref:Uncharacterized protein n=1 Tax=Caerostris extrusa TaxID=172846 RepID=A0AAV4XJY8_CAEEX|nr:hypothetical protein CEXT_71641 [Caerostris extrusa]
MSRSAGQKKLLRNTENKGEKTTPFAKKKRSSSFGMLCRRALQQRFRRSREAIPSLRFPEGGMFFSGTQEKKEIKSPRICSALSASHAPLPIYHGKLDMQVKKKTLCCVISEKNKEEKMPLLIFL